MEKKMLTGKTKQIFDILTETNDWVSVRKIITKVWGPESMDTDHSSIKWRKNLSGHLSKIKSSMKPGYELQKSSDLDAVKILSKQESFSHVTCTACESRFVFKNIMLNNTCSSQLYCVKCLYEMMEDLGI
tara:strand:- start:563 stop:952 length:390 start_codon:yes stop_codon:yes gene_type:complete